MVNKEKEDTTTDITAGVIPPNGETAIVSPQKKKKAVGEEKEEEEKQGEEDEKEEGDEGKKDSPEKNSEDASTSRSDANADAAAAAASATAKAIVAAAAATLTESKAASERFRMFNEEQEKDQLKLKQAALAEFQRREQALAAEKAEQAQQEEQAWQDSSQADKLDKLKLSVAEQALLDFNWDVSPQLASPVPASGDWITPEQLKGLLAVASQKYCIALYLNDDIHLLHLAFMIGEEVYACTSKGGISGEQYVKFNHSEFCLPMSGLVKTAVFAGNTERVIQIPTTLDLLAATDTDSFIKGTPLLTEVHLDVARLTARPSYVILLSGELYYSLVTSFGMPAEEYGFKCGGLEALSHIKSVASAGDSSERYDLFLYNLDSNPIRLSHTRSSYCRNMFLCMATVGKFLLRML